MQCQRATRRPRSVRPSRPPSRNYTAEKPVADGHRIYASSTTTTGRRSTRASTERDALAALASRNRVDRGRMAASDCRSICSCRRTSSRRIRPCCSSRARARFVPRAARTSRRVSRLHPDERTGRRVSDLQVHVRTLDPKLTSSWPLPTRAYTIWVQQVISDVRRTLDYLETRPDFEPGWRTSACPGARGCRPSPSPSNPDS